MRVDDDLGDLYKVTYIIFKNGEEIIYYTLAHNFDEAIEQARTFTLEGEELVGVEYFTCLFFGKVPNA